MSEVSMDVQDVAPVMTWYEIGTGALARIPDPVRAVATALELVLQRCQLAPTVRFRLADGAVVPSREVGDADSFPLGAVLAAASPGGVPVSAILADALPGPDPLQPQPIELLVDQASPTLRVQVLAEADAFFVERLVSHLRTIFQASAARPDDSFSSVDLLTTEDLRLLLGEWNAPEVAYPPTTLHRMFTDQAARTPDAPALISEERVVTYAELDAASNRVARRVREHLERAGQVVAVCGPRSVETLIAKVGVMKAGAAFLYLDPDSPSAWNETVCRIGGPVVVVATRHHVVSSPGAVHLVLEDLVEDTTTLSSPLDEIAGPETAAYVLFTSGSTGEPKGVLRPHRMHTTRIMLEQARYRCGPSDRHLMKSVPFFREFYWALATGGAAVVARPGGERDDSYLFRLMRDQRITVCGFVPSMQRVLLNAGGFSSPELRIRHLFVAGEVFDIELEREIREFVPELHITYTLAEADYVTHRGGPPGDADLRGSVGRPIDMRIYLTDSQGRLVPPGQVGEIRTGGPGLALGYVNRPELTAERFTPNPFDPDRTPTLYRSGDLARFRHDGELEFVGRADAQIKVRGQRVEPTEVEHALRAHEAVRDVVVTGLPDPDQGYVLAAYVTTVDGTLDTSELKADLGQRLPSYMIPTYIVQVPNLPQLTSGKLDRAALRTAVTARPVSLGPVALPSDDLERLLVDLWSTVLGTTEVGVDDTFVDLGGDSLKMMVLRVALEQAVGRPVGLAALMEAPTIRDLADVLRDGR